ncbi:MAG: cytidine deaminase [Lunatimonas sp.]|uniref:cytidine deaminase n=1 Tax=Lunatimonas sp. TaxID=2060141 RepID=UPI00263B0170|nr:cytidine deaminase [Lunatimonas sp.]MCC5936714.1 cytidine deaminase [Lunatimonas sp.]
MPPKKIKQVSELTEWEWEELDSGKQSLVSAAQKALETAYAPYSQFLVGAAVLLDNENVFAASNQENVSFPVGTCAERLALGYAYGQFPKAKPLKIAIAARRTSDLSTYAAVTPCGMCRQSISEYEVLFGQEMEILILTPQKTVLIGEGIKQFLPFKFEDLNR